MGSKREATLSHAMVRVECGGWRVSAEKNRAEKIHWEVPRHERHTLSVGQTASCVRSSLLNT